MKGNEDYINGVRLLLHMSKEAKFPIRKYPWVLEFSRILSTQNVCLRFWSNVQRQKRLERIPLCGSADDIFFGFKKSLFAWCDTPEGGTFWSKMLTAVLFPQGDPKRHSKLDELSDGAYEK